MQIIRIVLKFALIIPREMFQFCRFVLINRHINFVEKPFFALIFFLHLYYIFSTDFLNNS